MARTMKMSPAHKAGVRVVFLLLSTGEYPKAEEVVLTTPYRSLHPLWIRIDKIIFASIKGKCDLQSALATGIARWESEMRYHMTPQDYMRIQRAYKTGAYRDESKNFQMGYWSHRNRLLSKYGKGNKPSAGIGLTKSGKTSHSD